jgi:FMN phosphatase YigB (HAD superfamily)
MTTKALLYDAGGTLIWRDFKLADVHALVAARYSDTPTIEALERALPDPVYFFYVYPLNDPSVPWQVHNEEAFRRSAAEYYARAFLRAGLQANEAELQSLLSQVHDMAWTPNVWIPFPEASRVLEEGKRRGYIQGVISDAAAAMAGVLDHLGLDRYLDFVIISALTGLSKPDATIFEMGLRRSGVRPEEALYIGDNYMPDVLGARSAGVPVLLIDRWGFAASATTIDVPTIRSLDEVWDHVQA